MRQLGEDSGPCFFPKTALACFVLSGYDFELGSLLHRTTATVSERAIVSLRCSWLEEGAKRHETHPIAGRRRKFRSTAKDALAPPLCNQAHPCGDVLRCCRVPIRVAEDSADQFGVETGGWSEGGGCSGSFLEASPLLAAHRTRTPTLGPPRLDAKGRYARASSGVERMQRKLQLSSRRECGKEVLQSGTGMRCRRPCARPRTAIHERAVCVSAGAVAALAAGPAGSNSKKAPTHEHVQKRIPGPSNPVRSGSGSCGVSSIAISLDPATLCAMGTFSHRQNWENCIWLLTMHTTGTKRSRCLFFSFCLLLQLFPKVSELMGS